MGKRDSGGRPVWGYISSGPRRGGKADDLERIIPENLANSALVSAGSEELILPHVEVLQVIVLAARHQIAILGVEAFEVRKDGAILALDCSEYEFVFSGDWSAFVVVNNSSAELWIQRHRLGENHGYILTSASQKEFEALRHGPNPPTRR